MATSDHMAWPGRPDIKPSRPSSPQTKSGEQQQVAQMDMQLKTDATKV